MNIQAMMQQAQKIQKDMMKAKAEIDAKTYEGKSSFVTVNVKGSKEIESVIIDKESLDKDDIEMLQDMIMVAINDANNKVDETTEKKMAKYNNIPG